MAVAMSNPTTNRLLSKLLAEPDELITEPVISTSETVYAQVGLSLLKVVDMVCTSLNYLSLMDVDSLRKR